MEKLNTIMEFKNNIDTNLLIDILIAIGIFIIFKILSSLLSYVIIKIFNMKVKDNKKIKENVLYKPLKRIFSLIGSYIAISFLKIPEQPMFWITKIFRICLIITVANALGNCLTPKSKLMKRMKENDKITTNNKATDFIGKVIRTIIYIIAGFMIIFELGYDLSGIITGLGIGSVVIALAAQDIAKNLFSGIVLLFDKPFMIGDYVKIDNIEGTVDDMSFRAIRIRALDNTLVTIPNNKISEGNVINYTKMEKRRYELDLLVRPDTNIDKLEIVIERIKEELINNRFVIEDTINVHLNNVTDKGININIYLYTKIVDTTEFLDFKESINIKILRILKEENIELVNNYNVIKMK